MIERSTRRVVLIGMAAAAAVPRMALARQAIAPAALDEALRAPVQKGELVGVVAVAGTRDEVIYEGAFGRRGTNHTAEMSVDSVFWIASMTKAITTAAAMQQVELGKLALDQPAGEVLPELASPMVLEGFDAQGQPQLRPAKGPVTLRYLLTHTAGFSYDVWNADIGRYMQVKGVPGVITCTNAALTTPLVADPGERWEYGINIDFAGKMVEKVSGQRLEQYFKENLTGPLGMVDTAFKIGPDQRRRLVTMESRDAGGQLKAIEFELPQEPEFFMGGGGLYSTGRDYLRFTRMILRGGELDGTRVLRPETVAMMGQNQIGDIRVTKLVTTAPASSNDAEFFEGMPKSWGLGFMINDEPAPTGRSAGSLAWAGLGNTYFWIDPKKGVTGVVLTQLLPFADEPSLRTLGNFERAVYAAV
jgi:methyl acetate hydrolase